MRHVGLSAAPDVEVVEERDFASGAAAQYPPMRRRASELIREYKFVNCPVIRNFERSTSPNSLGSSAGLVIISNLLRWTY